MLLILSYNNGKKFTKIQSALGKGLFLPYPKTRDLFKDLINSIDNRFIIELVGLRRVGKSTLFFQIINHLIKEKKVNP